MLLTWKRKKPTWIEVCSIFCCCGCRKCSLRYDCLMWLRHILLRLSWISNWNVCLSYFRFLISGSDFWHQALTHFRHFLYISHLFLSSPRPPSWSSSLITCVVFGCRWQSCFFKMLLYKKKKKKLDMTVVDLLILHILLLSHFPAHLLFFSILPYWFASVKKI